MHLNHNNNELAIALGIKHGCCPSVELAVGLFNHDSGVSILSILIPLLHYSTSFSLGMELLRPFAARLTELTS